MLNLKNDNATLQISVCGYEFEVTNDKYDDNWLNVKLFLTDYLNDYNFNTTDPCLLTFELNALKKWFEDIKKEEDCNKEISFIEPCLGFKLIDKKLRIILNYNFKPGNSNKPYYFDISLENLNISLIIRDTLTVMNKFPER